MSCAYYITVMRTKPDNVQIKSNQNSFINSSKYC